MAFGFNKRGLHPKNASIRDEDFQPKPKSSGPSAPPSHGDESNWLVSYADMMTLLCGFFIMMFAISTVDQQKFETVKKDLAEQFKGRYEKPATADVARLISEICSR